MSNHRAPCLHQLYRAEEWLQPPHVAVVRHHLYGFRGHGLYPLGLKVHSLLSDEVQEIIGRVIFYKSMRFSVVAKP
ncbi:MAG: hypothetical protein M3Y56_13585 [Armatimonadota bacterium]|nr:hypothetical protein [Armatimonadota bacterium]